ncbi:B-cell receptor-associated protein 31-like-domain-containing protein [Syncephalis pseudoplumigaleata]|uniref:Endoplasmic reticulum transmembrane protein n=1 Tax=Syncephalis pseudoplumigaleata TaxID=1712513 RepID=A0A4P9YYB2_9FUNG|nr:B-cell receptor-associated protein 31-like-domain-containing protein [Syncephalis pseudoplumigaleata]|eukprot:RKP24331.1 B-cell receptor-associated protein 31-like-domain-containing protein [Syncephalis pseudoplumigaleata]
MTLYYTIIFALLVGEVGGGSLLLLAPLPLGFRRQLFNLLSRSDVVARLEYSLKIVFVFVFILFADAVNRMWRTQADLDKRDTMPDARTDANLHLKMFYNQRNMYLTGFTLFLSLIVARLHTIMVKMTEREEEFERIKRSVSMRASSPRTLRLTHALGGGAIASLQDKLKEAEGRVRDADTLKKQADQQHKEYMRLTDQYNELEVTASGVARHSVTGC